MRAFAAVLALGLPIASAVPARAGDLVLQRVILVQRHGVRPPTQTAEALSRLSRDPWPVWSVPPGDLTPHGAQTVRLMGATLRQAYADAGLIPRDGCASAGRLAVYADGADQRTRQSGEVLAAAMAPGCGVAAVHGPEGEVDPLFDSLGQCPVDVAASKAAILEAAGGMFETSAVRNALDRLQTIVAPEACSGGPGACLKGESQLVAGKDGAKLQGPLSVGATLAENLLLEYAEGLPAKDVGWGRAASTEAVAEVMPAHEREADLTRRTPYIAARRGGVMAASILAALSGEASPYFGKDATVIAFAGHDTNLSNMAGVFGLDWRLADQPDSTAPATTLAFELWRDRKTGSLSVKPVLFYEPLEQLRTLQPTFARRVALRFKGCGDPSGRCSLSRVRAAVEALVPKTCRAPTALHSKAAPTASTHP